MTEARRQAIQKLKDSGHYQAIGRKGGKANVAKHGIEHMQAIGLRGGQGLRNKFGTEEEAKAYYSRIGSITTKEDQ